MRKSANTQNSVDRERISGPIADTVDGSAAGEIANNEEVILKDEGEPAYRFVRGGRHIPSAVAQPVEIPLKWKRLVPELPAFSWDMAKPIDDSALEAFTSKIWQAISTSVDAWLSSPEGQSEAWRDVDRHS